MVGGLKKDYRGNPYDHYEKIVMLEKPVGKGLCMPLGIRVYDEWPAAWLHKTAHFDIRKLQCHNACRKQFTPRAYGPWKSRGRARGYALTPNGRCYCQHAKHATCKKAHFNYFAYEYDYSYAHARAFANGVATRLPYRRN